MVIMQSAVIFLLATVLVQKSDAQCDGGCCDCLPIPFEPPPCLTCIEPQPVLPPPDTVPPVIHGCPVDMSRTLPSGHDTISVCWTEPWASDNRGPAYIKPVRQGPAPCSPFREGLHSIGYTAGDYAGNTAMCQFTIKIHAIVCTHLSAPQNARVTCSRENKQGSSCHYYCDSNFQLVSGSKERICGAGGQWSGTEAVCEMRRCGILMPPTNGRLSCRGGDVPGSTCTYHCSVGYFIESGTETRRCRADGHWSGTEVRCTARLCSQLSPPANGYVSCTGSKPGSNCHYRCDHGYYIEHGSTTRVCRSTGEWTGTSASCQKRVVNCPTLQPPNNGDVTCEGDSQPGTWCTYTCDRGYELDGARTRVCGSEGRWTSSPPTCISKSCGRLPDPANGRVSCDRGEVVGSRCQYVCNRGYHIASGSEHRTCQASRYDRSASWSGSEVTCEAQSCERLRDPANGRVSCDRGEAMGSRCQYVCNRGYRIASGSEHRTCQSSRYDSSAGWSGSEVTCEAMTCPYLNHPPNGAIRCNGNRYGSECQYDCSPGYSFSGGSRSRTCLQTGQWSGTEVTCIVGSCYPLSPVAHASIRCEGNNEIGTRCMYTCDPGYNLEGVNYRECIRGSNGVGAVWSGQEPYCADEAEQICPLVLTPPNAIKECTSEIYKSGTSCSYTCEYGYRYIRGPRRKRCRKDGTWTSEDDIVCEAYGCSPLRDPLNGYIRCQGNNEIGSRCMYVCDESYQLIGTNYRDCVAGSNGVGAVWSGSEPRCDRSQQVKSCFPLDPPENGRMHCEPRGGSAIGTVCTFTCSTGYRLSSGSSRTRECRGRVGRLDPYWSGQVARCEPKASTDSCPTLLDPPNGSVYCEGQSEGDRCQYTCDEGYSVTSGSRMRTCEGGRWSDTEPVCSVSTITCPTLLDPRNGYVYCEGQSEGNRCQYACDEGYSVTHGSRMRECEDGRWTGVEPICSESSNSCPTLPDPPNGSVYCEGLLEGDRCQYTCDEGYTVTSGSHMRICEGGRWTDEEPVCIGVQRDCPRLPHPPYGAVSCEGLEAGDKCRYTCSRGYSLTDGSKERTCQTNGRWTGSEAVCTGSRCEPLLPPDNGNVVCSGKATYGCKCNYYCNIGYYVSSGSYTRYCDVNGWTGRRATCSTVAVRCTNRYSCSRSCGYSRCSNSATRLQRSIDSIRNHPKAITHVDEDVADMLN